MRAASVFIPPTFAARTGVHASRPYWGQSRLAAIMILLGMVPVSRGFSLSAGTVQFDLSTSPETFAWVQSVSTTAKEWYPRLGNLLSSSTDVRLPEVTIRISHTYDGIAAASGNVIEMSAKRVVAVPDDSRGVVIHELVHVVQGYPGGSEAWLTEGIADYIRYAIFESMPLADFPRPEKERGYRDSYKVAAGFLFWLESGPAPGIVRQVNAALRNGIYQESVFKERTGRDLPQLWTEYCAAFPQPKVLPPVTQLWRHSRGWFALQTDGTWAEFDQGKKVWTFQEVGRTKDAIELLDLGRNMRLRLMSREVRFLSDGDWRVIYQGEWGAPQ